MLPGYYLSLPEISQILYDPPYEPVEDFGLLLGYQARSTVSMVESTAKMALLTTWAWFLTTAVQL